jgi:hypothetical protein
MDFPLPGGGPLAAVLIEPDIAGMKLFVHPAGSPGEVHLHDRACGGRGCQIIQRAKSVLFPNPRGCTDRADDRLRVGHGLAQRLAVAERDDPIVERIIERRVEVPVVREVIRYVERPAIAATAPVSGGPSPYELEDWAKLRRNMSKASVRVLLGDPQGVTGSGQEVWTFPFNGKATFGYDGKLESWQVPGTSAR